MDTYTIIPRARTYRVVATAADGKQTIIAVYRTEQAAMARLKHLQEKAGMVLSELRIPRSWRG